MLLRTISGLIGLSVLLGALWAGLVWVFLLTLIAAVLGIREFYRLHPPASPPLEPEILSTDYWPTGVVHSEQDTSVTSESGDLFPGESAEPLPGIPAVEPELETPAPDTLPIGDVSTTQEVSAPDLAPAGCAPISDSPVDSPSQPSPTPLPALLGAAWVGAFVIGGAGANGVIQFWAISLGIWGFGAFVALLWLIAFYRGTRWPVATAYLMSGPVYVGFLLAHVLLLAQVGEVFFYLDPLAFNPEVGPTVYELGRNWLLFALLTNFATDSGAYFVGRAIGRHPMAPVTSPNKTWEGAAGGFLCAVIAAFLLDRVLYLGFGPTAWDGAWAAWNWQPVVIGATVGIASQFGDLLESRLKRISQVKDSGFLVPGHGGALDRLDSLLITIPAVYYLLMAVLRP